MRKKVFLEGEELQQYLEDQRIAKEREAKRKAVLARSRRVAEADDESDSSDSDSELGEGEAGPDADGEGEGGNGENGQLEAESKPDRRTNDALSAPKKRKYDEFTDSQDATGALSFDIYVRDEAGKSTRKFRSLVQGRVRMFPFSERRRKVDVYGEVVDVQAWIRKSHVDEAKNDIRGPVSGATEEVVEKVIHLTIVQRFLPPDEYLKPFRNPPSRRPNMYQKLPASTSSAACLSWTWKGKRTGKLSRRF